MNFLHICHYCGHELKSKDWICENCKMSIPSKEILLKATIIRTSLIVCFLILIVIILFLK